MSYFRCKNEKCKIYNGRFEEVVIINGEKKCPVCEKKLVVRVRPLPGAENLGGGTKEIEIPLNKN